MSQLLLVMVDCNDYRNGAFTGRVEHVHVTDPADHEILVELYACRVPYLRHETVVQPTRSMAGVVQLGKEHYQVRSWKAWVGNWCWNGGLMVPAEAERLATDLLARGFEPESWVEDGPIWEILKTQRPNLAEAA